jgi:hypothetical protein
VHGSAAAPSGRALLAVLLAVLLARPSGLTGGRELTDRPHVT